MSGLWYFGAEAWRGSLCLTVRGVVVGAKCVVQAQSVLLAVIEE